MQLSKHKVEIIEELQKPKTYLLHRNGDLMSSGRRKSCNTGTWIVKIVRGEEVLLKRVNWRAAKPMVDIGFLELKAEREHKGKLYVLTDSVESITKRAKEKQLKPRKTMVFSERVKEIAARYGCKITYKRLHLWFVLERLDRAKLKNPYIAYSKSGKTVTKLSDMTIEEWEEAIREQSEWVEPCNQNELTLETAAPPEDESNTSS